MEIIKIIKNHNLSYTCKIDKIFTLVDFAINVNILPDAFIRVLDNDNNDILTCLLTLHSPDNNYELKHYQLISTFVEKKYYNCKHTNKNNKTSFDCLLDKNCKMFNDVVLNDRITYMLFIVITTYIANYDEINCNFVIDVLTYVTNFNFHYCQYERVIQLFADKCPNVLLLVSDNQICPEFVKKYLSTRFNYYINKYKLKSTICSTFEKEPQGEQHEDPQEEQHEEPQEEQHEEPQEETNNILSGYKSDDELLEENDDKDIFNMQKQNVEHTDEHENDSNSDNDSQQKINYAINFYDNQTDTTIESSDFVEYYDENKTEQKHESQNDPKTTHIILEQIKTIIVDNHNDTNNREMLLSLVKCLQLIV